MCKKKFFLVIVFLGLIMGGCSWPQWPGSGDEQAVNRQERQEGREERKQRPELGTVQAAGSVAGQKENPVLGPEEHGIRIAGIQETLTTLLQGMRIKDLSKAETCFHGLDQTGSTVSLEELQREVESLHPLDWRIESCITAGAGAAVVEVSYTMPDGEVYKAEPFSVMSMGDTWSIHYNSFAGSFHAMAGHLLKDSKPKGLHQENKFKTGDNLEATGS
ncbi:MAG: hypothetical protein MJA84_12355 [Firmicutes bacterium]|nr:hypothetical protein [Bacillota bacterium]